MARDTRVQLYVEESTRDQLKREAEDRDLTLSTYLHRLVDRGRDEELQADLTDRTDVEARLEQTIEESIASYHDELLDAVRKASVYSIANYELDAGTSGFDASGATRQDTFATGRRRTYTPLSEHHETMAADSATETDLDESDPESDAEESTGSLTDITRGD
jgi:hypothetical protein